MMPSSRGIMFIMCNIFKILREEEVMSYRWIQFAVSYLLITALAGVFMRSMAIFPITGIEYEYILHAHSHLALLGWGYMSVFLLFLAEFFDKTEQQQVQIKILFWSTQFTIIGMFISFSLQGYALFSIAFSTIQVLLSYWFVIITWRHLRYKAIAMQGQPISFLYVKASLVCLVLSSIGPWSLAILSANELQDSPLYEAAVYFYLHFQYNGWFTLGLLAVLLRIFEKRGVIIPHSLLKIQLGLYVGSILPSFILSVLWMEIHFIWYVIAALAGAVQWIAMVIFCHYIYRIRAIVKEIFQGWGRGLLIIAMVVLLIKVTLELGLVMPGLTELIYSSRSIVIGYLHLTLLGFVSILCLSLFLHQGWLNETWKSSRLGYSLFLIFFGVNEFILFLQGLYDWTEWTNEDLAMFGPVWLWIASMGMAVGVGLLWPKKIALRAK
jgi:hypothetical protein